MKQLCICLFILGPLSVIFVSGQKVTQQKQQSESVLRQSIRFIDSSTGYAISPEEFSIRDNRINKVVYRRLLSRDTVAGQQRKGFLSLSLPPGSYQYTVKASGYKTMISIFTIDKNSPDRIDFHLDPIEVPPEIKPSVVQPLHRPDATVMVGFVVDDDTGQPIPGVRVSTAGSASGSITNGRGFFILYIPTPLDFQLGMTAEVSFEKEEYHAQNKQVKLMPNADWIYRIRLTPRENSLHLKKKESPETLRERTHDSHSLQTPERIYAASISVPVTIRMGRNCSTSTSCRGCPLVRRK